MFCNFLIVLLIPVISCYDWSSLNLVKTHVPYVLSHQPYLKQLCLEDSSCPYQEDAKHNLCWGFEPNCKNPFDQAFPTLDCSNEESKRRYWKQADFGYLQSQLEDLNSRVLCKPINKHSSSLQCTRESTMCRARNLYIDLRNVDERKTPRDRVVLQPGEIGGYCKLDQSALNAETAVKRDLSTWGEQLGPYSELAFDPFSDPNTHCDKVITDPVIFVQLDFGGNMYHHFCDFFNLYLTQMANESWFGTDVNVVRWSLSSRYPDLFESSWKAFTSKELTSLYHFGKERICISNAIFSFLPRMAFGLFYSTPLENNCRETGLFRAFSQHFLYRMGIVDENIAPIPPLRIGTPNNIRVTFIDRGHTDKYEIFRKITNQKELVAAIETLPDLSVKVVRYSSAIPFEEQLRITHNTDIFIGMHGAGLAHFMFLPDWAVAFELYNCGDFRCYRDLARLRGLHYITWERPDKLTEHKDTKSQHSNNPKFWNFSFDVPEFLRLVKKARELVLKHPRFNHVMNRDEL